MGRFGMLLHPSGFSHFTGQGEVVITVDYRKDQVGDYGDPTQRSDIFYLYYQMSIIL